MAEDSVFICGGFPARVGLETVRNTLAAGFPAAEVDIHDWGGDFGPSLHFKTEGVFFGSLYIPDEDVFLFDGSVQGSLEEAIAFTGRLSECLATANLEHSFHVSTGPMAYAASFVYPPETNDAE